VVLGVGYVTAQDLFVRLPADPPAKNPLEGNADAITAGMGAYRQRCADCHGVDARGIRSPDITQVWARGRTDGALFGIVRNGIPGTEMPAHPAPRTSDTDVWRILAYLKTLAAPVPADAPPGSAGAGENLFVRNCLGCHRVGDRGGHLGPDLSRIGAARARAALGRQIRGNVADFRTGYEPVTLTTPEGHQIRGVKKNEDMFSVQIMDSTERIQGYLREDMRAVTNEKQSAMPAFGSERLSDAELDDLLAYLTALQGAVPSEQTGNR
jgi:putative heme-binding domain-containing protein